MKQTFTKIHHAEIQTIGMDGKSLTVHITLLSGRIVSVEGPCISLFLATGRHPRKTVSRDDLNNCLFRLQFDQRREFLTQLRTTIRTMAEDHVAENEPQYTALAMESKGGSV